MFGIGTQVFGVGLLGDLKTGDVKLLWEQEALAKQIKLIIFSQIRKGAACHIFANHEWFSYLALKKWRPIWLKLINELINKWTVFLPPWWRKTVKRISDSLWVVLELESQCNLSHKLVNKCFISSLKLPWRAWEPEVAFSWVSLLSLYNIHADIQNICFSGTIEIIFSFLQHFTWQHVIDVFFIIFLCNS